MTTPSESPFTPVSGQQQMGSPGGQWHGDQDATRQYAPQAGTAADHGTPPPQDPDGADDPRSRNWIGITAFIAGVFGLSVVAIVLGHLGLSAVKKGRATNRPWALAGTILGYVALAATAALGAAYYLGLADQWRSSTHDAHAQADVNAVGRAMALAWADTGAPPAVVQGDGEYVVNTTTIDAYLTAEHEVVDTIVSAVDWCVMITYEGGTYEAYSYLPTEGVVAGAQCEPAAEPSPEPSASPSTEPNNSASPEATVGAED